MKDRNLELFEKIGEIDPQYILEGKNNKKEKNKWKIITSAACIGLCIISGASVVYAGRNHIQLLSQVRDKELKICENKIQVDFEPILESDLGGGISEVRKHSKDYYSQYFVDYDTNAAAFKIEEFTENNSFNDSDSLNKFMGGKFFQIPIDNKTKYDIQLCGNEKGKITNIRLSTEFTFKEKTISALNIVVTDQMVIPNIMVNTYSKSINFLNNQLLFNRSSSNQSKEDINQKLAGITFFSDDANILTGHLYKNKHKLDTLILQSENSNKLTTFGMFHEEGCLYVFGIEGKLDDKEVNISIMKDFLDLYYEEK